MIHRAHIRDVVRSKRAEARAYERRTGKGAGLQLEEAVGGDNRAVALDAELHGIDAPEVGPVALNTSSRLITIFTGWPDLRASMTATGSM